MQIVATKLYTRKVKKLLTTAQRQAAEHEIMADPLRWPVIAGTGGVRKARAARGSSGKSGGVRIIYYHWTDRDTLVLLTVYAKSQQADLTAADKKVLHERIKTIAGV